MLGVKLGSKGVLLSPAAGEYIEIPGVAPPGPIVDTTGAGDCFYAGLLTGLLRGMDVRSAGCWRRDRCLLHHGPGGDGRHSAILPPRPRWRGSPPDGMPHVKIATLRPCGPGVQSKNRAEESAFAEVLPLLRLGNAAMPLHDWTRAPSGLFHHFHQSWSVRITESPECRPSTKGDIALVEQRSGPREPDVLAIEARARRGPILTRPAAGVATLEPPVTQMVHRSDKETYAGRANRIAIATISAGSWR